VKERTLDRAREALGVTARRKGFGQGAHYEWSMPAMHAPPLADGAHGEHGMHAMLAVPAMLEGMGEHGGDDGPETTESDQ
jgi:hypothetical protein